MRMWDEVVFCILLIINMIVTAIGGWTIGTWITRWLGIDDK